jgi:tetratricopeptide (TPR) repeat protein
MPTEREFQAMMLVSQAMDAAMFGDFEETISLLSQALQFAPNDAVIYHNRGMANARLEHWRDALADFSRAAQLDPQPTTYEQRGIVQYQMGNHAAARQDWEDALRLNPRRPLALANLGWACIEARDFRQAIDYLSRAISIEPTFGKAYENRARAYFEMGSVTQARADLAKARELVVSGQDTSDQDLRD